MRHSALEGETLGYLVSARHLPSAGTVPRQPQAYDSAQGALEDETSMRGARCASKKAFLAQTRHVTAQRPPKRLLTLGIHLYADVLRSKNNYSVSYNLYMSVHVTQPY